MAVVNNIVDADVSGTANILDTKHRGKFSKVYSQTGTVGNTTQYLHTVIGATGVVRKFSAMITETVATGADRTVTIDLQKSSGGGAFATILSGTIGFTNGSTALIASNATISSGALAAGDVLKTTVVVAGSAGAQALGLLIDLRVGEDAGNGQ